MFKRKTRDRLASVSQLLDGYKLPSFPHVITDALGRLGDPDVSMGDVARVLEMDPGISVHLLKLVNSAAVGLRNPVDSLQQAVTMLGRNQVESILITTGARASVPEPLSPVFDSARFWTAAASRAVIATSISAVIEPSRRSETFTAALLQDMALPVLVDHIDGYAVLLQQWYAGDVVDLAAAEDAAFGWDHASVATRMGTMWDFPETLLEAIAGHHDTDESMGTDLVGVRAVSGWHEVDEELSRTVILETICTIPQLHGHDCEALLDEALGRVAEVAALFG